MGQVTFEFPLPDDACWLDGDTLTVELGNGIRLKSKAPEWILHINKATLQIILEIDGSPPSASPIQPPI